MKRYLLFLLLFINLVASGQGTNPVYIGFASGRAQDTAKTTSNLLVMGAGRFPFYATGDTTLFPAFDAGGNIVLRRLNQDFTPYAKKTDLADTAAVLNDKYNVLYATKQNNIGYTPENLAAKVDNLNGNSSILYPTQRAARWAIDSTIGVWTKPGKNRINNDSVESGNYGANGAKIANTSWIRTPPTIPVPGGVKVTVSGVGNLTGGQRRFSWFDSLHVFISDTVGNGTGVQSAITPQNARYVGITIANVVGIGNDPTHSQYAGTMQFEVGPQTSYRAFGQTLDASKMDGLPPAAAPRDTFFTTYRTLYDSVEPSFTYSKNLINSQTVLGSVWSTVGNISSSPNWLCVPKLWVWHDSAYTLSGAGVLSLAATRAVFFDAAGVFIPGSLVLGNGSATQTIIVPSNAVYIGLNIANVTGIGNTPTNNVYTNTVQFERKSSATTYAAFGYGPDATKLQGNIPGVVTTTDFNSRMVPVETNTNYLISNYNVFGRLDTTSKIALPQGYTLNIDGDYLEFTGRKGLGSVYTDWFGMFGVRGGGANTFGYYDATHMYLRESLSGSPYVVFNTPNTLTSFHTIRLAVADGGTNWKLYIDSLLTDTQPKTNSYVLNTIGDAYLSATRFSRFDLQNVRIHTSVADLTISDPSVAQGQINVGKTYESKVPVQSYRPVYVSYTPATTPNFNNSIFGNAIYTVYVRRGDSNIYTGYRVVHEIDTSNSPTPAPNSGRKDYYRLFDGNEYSYSGGVMIPLNQTTLVGGENECVMQENGTNDFMGGYHGNEKYLTIAFYLDGVQDTNTIYTRNLMPASSFSYIETSTMSAAPRSDLSNPYRIIAHHLKKTVFTAGNFTTYNRITWDTIVNMAVWYSGITCVGKPQASQAYNDHMDAPFYFTGAGLDTSYYLRDTGIYRGYYASNPATGLAARVTSNITKPAGADIKASMKIWDRADDSKYYRQYFPTSFTKAGEVWESTTSVSTNSADATPDFQTTFFDGKRINYSSVPVYTDNASAVAGGEPSGTLYRTSTGALMIVY